MRHLGFGLFRRVLFRLFHQGVCLRLGQHALLDQRVNKIEHRIAQLEQIRLFAGADGRGGGQADEQNGKTS